MSRIRSFLGYTAAALTIVAAILTPFVLFNWFADGVAALGLRVDPAYTGGDVAYSIEKGPYSIQVHRPFFPHTPLSHTAAYVQIAWTPASALPSQVSDEVDVDHDGVPDLIARFEVPREVDAPLRVSVTPLTARVQPMQNVGRESFSSMIARIEDRIVVRVPLGSSRP